MKLNILIAYPYFTKSTFEFLSSQNRDDYRLMIDSGAFTAYNSKKEITYEGYAKFLNEIKSLKPDVSVQLDVVFNPEKTQENYKRHLDDGHDVSPVFTKGDSFEYLDELIKQDKYVFVGGVQKGPNAKVFAKKILETYPGKKIHYLAFVKREWLVHYKPYSVDSSTHANGARFGMLFLYDKEMRVRSLNRNHFVKKPTQKIYNLFAGMGLDTDFVKRFSNYEVWRGKDKEHTLEFVNACSYVKYAMEMEKRIGTKIYLATSSTKTKGLLDAFYHLKKAGAI